MSVIYEPKTKQSDSSIATRHGKIIIIITKTITIIIIMVMNYVCIIILVLGIQFVIQGILIKYPHSKILL